MVAFRINRTNDAVFKAVFAKHPQITISLINAFFEFQGTELIEDIEFIDREMDADEYEGKESRLDSADAKVLHVQTERNADNAHGIIQKG